MFSFHVVGDRQLKRKLKKLTDKQFVRAVKSAAGKAMTPVSKAIRKNINLQYALPDEDGFLPLERNAAHIARVQQTLLRKTIGKRTKSYERGSVIYAVAGVKGGNVQRKLGLSQSAAHNAEYGVGDIPPQPFVRPAMQTLKTQAIRVYTKQLAAWIEKNAKKK